MYEYNLDNLTDEQKRQLEERYKNTDFSEIQKEIDNNDNSAEIFFNQFHWVKIENFISKETADILYHHVKHNAIRLDVLYQGWQDKSREDKQLINQIWGTFDDPQAEGDFSKYGDPIFDSLLDSSLPQMEKLVGKKLLPNYSYHRLYTNDTELTKHKDRPSCEISTTLCLGYDNSNVDSKTYPDYNWPMWVQQDGGKALPIQMKPGDMLIYRGCEVWHWREHFKGNNHAQLFMHYNEADGEYNIKYDGRPFLGLPSSYRNEESVNVNDKDNDFLK